MKNQISDASDFTHTRIPKLSQLDTLLRCHICKDFLKVPVLTPCGHTFCSLCIREYISVQAKCPLCLTELRESMLRSEFLVSEIVDSYKVIRDKLLDILRQSEEKTTDPDPDSSIIEVGSGPEDSLIENDNQNDDTCDDIQILQSNKPTSLKRTYTDIASSSLRTLPRSKYFKANIPVKRSSTASRIDSMLKKPVELVPCPICEKYFPVKELERTHLDECLTLQSLGNKPISLKQTSHKDEPVLNRSTVMSSKKSIPTGGLRTTKSREEGEVEEEISYVDKYINSTTDTEHQRLPKLDLPSMTITQVKQKLSNLGLSTAGTKQNMMARYNYYEILWNSNFCDSLNPVDVSELKRQLLSWETSRKVHNIANSSTSIGNLMVSRSANRHHDYKKLLDNFKTDKFNRKEWCLLFRKQFRRLIKDAKKGQISRLSKNEPIQESPKDEQLTDPDLSNDLFEKLDDQVHIP
ncbi:similar to Saccharomyces cerevisiae YCR066W RAD18 E3 ubiqutin ligase, forms heterodimer with Rad6p to monoubiquitinate PCNA-K164 [Maudiozyma saulgeensis]|uniref:Postreplication repair E3 ubiquitin-protein ligase RAD18 n=1 Tax=Maudiozyma saulgeensis TaxID=1789683 RepID=A0A1X7R507_9SACH|nr:similar to Saccharomyces cerevisiae YCR066W RAD18 E3 ubiqutin ligase, forms heterodimer with Rad6p to monoubiquitinate PCNA-K164 [Kazachstania saulgeensis]